MMARFVVARDRGASLALIACVGNRGDPRSMMAGRALVRIRDRGRRRMALLPMGANGSRATSSASAKRAFGDLVCSRDERQDADEHRSRAAA